MGRQWIAIQIHVGEWVVFHEVRHLALTCLYSSQDWTNHLEAFQGFASFFFNCIFRGNLREAVFICFCNHTKMLLLFHIMPYCLICWNTNHTVRHCCSRQLVGRRRGKLSAALSRHFSPMDPFHTHSSWLNCSQKYSAEEDDWLITWNSIMWDFQQGQALLCTLKCLWEKSFCNNIKFHHSHSGYTALHHYYCFSCSVTMLITYWYTEMIM